MKSVNLTLRLNSTEPTTDNDTAVEMALDRLGGQHIVALLHDAGFTVALPIDSDVLDCEFRPELGDERFELDGTDRTEYQYLSATHVHRITGELVRVTGHVNGITIFDSPIEPGEELLDEVFAEQYEPIPEPVYVATHRSCEDGSEAMLVGLTEDDEFILRNENGDEWPEPDLNDWEAI